MTPVPVRSVRIPAKDRAEEGIWWLLESGGYRAGDRLPAERDLCREIGVSRTALRSAIGALISNGILESRRGSGTYVRPRKPLDIFQETYNFCDAVRAAGMEPSARLIEAEVVVAGEPVALKMAIDPADPIFRLCRVRLADGDPVMMETAHVNLALCPGIDRCDFSSASLYGELEAGYGVRVEHGDERVSIARLDEGEARLLGVPAGSPVFFESAVGRDGSGCVVEYVKSVVLPDRFRFASNGFLLGAPASARPRVDEKWLRS